MILAGPLLDTDHAAVRLVESLDTLAPPQARGDSLREAAAYRIGLAVGLALGRMGRATR